tara:strand:+ start:1671 stop:2282 length:612 start_codon:yes stop_codon:yes gene_type:complete
MNKTRHAVHVVDDDESVRASIKFLVESVDLSGIEYGSADAFLRDYRDAGPGCVILDLRMPGMSGLEALDLMKQQSILEPIIIMTGHGDVPVTVRAFKQGVFDFLEKPCNDNLLIETINRAISADILERTNRKKIQSRRVALNSLTQREQGVLDLLVAGLSNKQIAEQFYLSPKTIERHRSSIMRKLKATSFAQLVRIAAPRVD